MFHLVLSDVARKWFEMFHPVLFDDAWSDLRCFTIVLMLLQYLFSVFHLLLLTCCDICILMFHCHLANGADVEFRCCRHVVLGVVSRGEEGWCWMLQKLIFNVADIGFRYCKHVILGVVLRRRREKDSWCWMLHATRIATWVAWVLCRGRRGKAPDVGCYTQHDSQYGSLHFSTNGLSCFKSDEHGSVRF
jgi:hypothetical protein